MKKLIPFLVALFLILLIGGVTVGKYLQEKYSYSKERADLEAYFQVQGDELAIILQDEMLPEKALLRDERVYFDLDTVHKYFNDVFYADVSEGLLLYTTPTQIRKTALGSTAEEVDGVPGELGYVAAFSQGEQIYVAADYVSRYTNLSLEYFPLHVQVYNQWGSRQEAVLAKDSAVRERGGIKSPILCDVARGDRVEILERMETWSKVKTEDAYIGYVENKLLTEEARVEETPVTSYAEPEYTTVPREGKVSLGFHSIAGTAGNDTLDAMAAGTMGMNVIAPTWFSLSDDEGNFESFGAVSYVERAHGLGLEVWGVVDDFNYSLNHNTQAVDVYRVLSSTARRTRLVEGLTQEALGLGLDGINVDFEHVSVDSGEHFAQFIRELSVACRKNGLVLSIDNYVPFGYNEYYRRDVQGKVADYVIIMGYDEHWHGSGSPGSVASIGYVSSGIDKTLEQVPKEKVINAIPFYSIVWKTEGANVTDEYLTLANTAGFLERIGAEAVWDEETAQSYVDWQDGSVHYQLWAETEESIAVKLNVMRAKEIAGVAVWQISFGTPAAWELISAYVNS